MNAAIVALSLSNLALLALVVLLFRHFEEIRSNDGLRWQAALNTINDSHAEELRRFSNMKLAGTTEIPSAIRIPMKPDAEARVAAQIKSDTINRGAERLQAEYAVNGMALSDEEARLQAESMLSGRSLSLD